MSLHDCLDLTAAGPVAAQEKLRRRLAGVELKPLNAPRPGKKVVVLDIDYTIFDLVPPPPPPPPNFSTWVTREGWCADVPP